MRGGGFALILVLAALGVVASPAHASVFAVDTTKDRLDANPGDGVCAAANGKCALRAAIQEANALAGIDNVNVSKGTFELTIPRSDTPGIEEGDLDITEAVAITGKSKKKTVIRQTERDRVIRSDATPALVPGAILTDLTLTGGDLRKEVHGGGILIEDHALLIQDAIVRGNRHTMKTNTFGLGGGIAANPGSALTLINTTVVRNEARGDFSTASAAGGGIFLHFEAEATITDSRIIKNRATTNGFSDTEGGGLYLQGPTTMSGTTIAKNRADVGGGMAMNSVTGLQSTSTTISENRARQGGAVAMDSSPLAPVEFTNSTISGNELFESEDPGTGAAFFVERGLLRLTHVTVADQVLGRGQANLAFADAPPPGGTSAEIANSILDNPRSECSGIEFLTSIEVSIIDDGSCTGGLSSNIVANARLKPLRTNPGPGPGRITQTHALKDSSPAIDFVTSGCPPPATDQVGHARPAGEGFCDAGSFEAPG